MKRSAASASTVPKRGKAIAAAACALAGGAVLLACVDLFHGTDFETVCTASPADPACSIDAAVPAEVGVDAAPSPPPLPPPDFCSWTAEEARAQAMRACAWLGACEGPLGESAFGPCVVRAQLAFNCKATPSLRPVGETEAFWACLSRVQKCGDVDACVFPGGVQPCVAVPAGSSDACGSVAANTRVHVRCVGAAGRAAGVEPCIMSGKTCATEDLSTASCAGSKKLDCSASECAGSSAVDCALKAAGPFDIGVDCAGVGGGSCLAADAGFSCTPGRGAGTCTSETPPTCDGSIVTSCVDGTETRVDCSAIGLPCDTSERVPFYDLAAACVDRTASACTVADSCTNGSMLESCGRGASFSVDCSKVGLGRCRIGEAGRGSCSPP